MYGWWARDFYSLRSKIVHEGVVAKNNLVNPKGAQHLLLALKILKFCLYRVVEQKGFVVFKTLQGDCFGPFAGFSYEKHHVERKLREVETLIG